MFKKTLLLGGALFFLSGCSLPLGGGRTTEAGSVWKSVDAGKAFEAKIKIDDTQVIANSDVLSLAMHPADPDTIYIGTETNGIFKTTDGAETWRHLEYPPTRVYGLVVDPTNGERVFASGLYENIGKLYRSEDGGVTWTEIYTEPGEGTVVSTLAIHPEVPGILVAGTSAGLVIQSTDGGATWKNVATASGPVTKVIFEKGLPGMRTILVFGQGTLVSQDEGRSWQDYTKNTSASATSDMSGSEPQSLFALAQDPKNQIVLYGGAENGLFRSTDRGRTWQPVNIIESSKAFPIRAIAVNPVNSSEIVYGSGAAFYKSVDGGNQWSVTDLQIGRGMSNLVYNPLRPEVIYFTLRTY